MARRSLVLTGPASSTGSPTTLMMRPSVSSPTGTEIGSPVSVTSWPRTRPSEVSIAMVRTVDSPRCCATSSTRRLPLLVVSSAFRIAGRWPSNCTSTTAPMTWVIFPVALAMWSSLPFRVSSRRFPEQRHRLECFSARDDLDHQRDDLLRGRNLRDHRLEARIEQRADIELAGIEHLDDRLGDVLGIPV